MVSLKLCKHLGNIKPFKPFSKHTYNILYRIYLLLLKYPYQAGQAYLDNMEPHNPAECPLAL